jgi:PD-(D/E)XK nuclease superfamily
MSYNERLRQRQDRPVLRFGTLIHRALADYYVIGRRRGADPIKSFIKHYEEDVARAGEFMMLVGDEYEDPEGTEWEDAKDLGIVMLERYLDSYKGDPDWEVLATEQPFQVLVRNPRNKRPMFYYVGILDLVIRQISTGRVWIVDHKTTGAIDLHGLGLNEQFGSYWAFGTEWLKEKQIIRPDHFNDLSGLMVNFLRRAKRDPRPTNDDGLYLNQDGTVSKRQPRPYFHREPTFRTEHDREQVRLRAMNDHREMMMARAGDLPINKRPSLFNCRGCSWLDACELHETGSDWKRFVDSTTEDYDPYAEHEIRNDELK